MASDDANGHEPDDDEPLPPLPLQGGGSFSRGRLLAIVAVAVVAVLVRLAIRVAANEREAERPEHTVMMIDDPGSDLPPDERAALEEALRRGEPLVLGADGRVRAARSTDAGAPAPASSR